MAQKITKHLLELLSPGARDILGYCFAPGQNKKILRTELPIVQECIRLSEKDLGEGLDELLDRGYILEEKDKYRFNTEQWSVNTRWLRT